MTELQCAQTLLELGTTSTSSSDRLLARIRNDLEMDRMWLLARNVTPLDTTHKHPKREPVTKQVKEITTPSPFKHAYTVVRMLGQGQDGLAYEVTDNYTKQTFVAKIMYVTKMVPMFDQDIPLEVKIMIDLDDVPNVPKVIRMFVENAMTIGNTFVWPSYIVVMTTPSVIPYAPAIRFMQNVTPYEIRTIFSRLVNTLKDVDDHNIAHNDLHAQNFLVSNPTKDVTLIDFGRAQYKNVSYDINMMLTYAGWIGSPPELRNIHRGKYTDPNDLVAMFDYDRMTTWRIGFLLYQFFGGNIQATFGKPYLDPSPFVRFPYRTTQMARDLMSKIFVPYQRRITLRQLFDHPYFDMTK